MEQGYPILNESTRTEDNYWRHNPCGELLDAKRVAHPVWDRRFTTAGDGSVQYETVPFCGKCGPEPSAHGEPIYVQSTPNEMC